MWYYNTEATIKNIIELWQKMNDVKRQTGHLNITDTARYGELKNVVVKKQKTLQEKKEKI